MNVFIAKIYVIFSIIGLSLIIVPLFSFKHNSLTNMLKGELCLDANKDAIFNKGIIEVEKTV